MAKEVMCDEDLTFHAVRLAEIIDDKLDLPAHLHSLVEDLIEDYFREDLDLGLGGK